MKLIGPIRKEMAILAFEIRGREVLLERHYDPQDQMEEFARQRIGAKLGILALQLQYKGVADEEIERLAGKLISLEKLTLMGLSGFLDCVTQRIGNFHDPVFVIEAIAENVTRFQPDSKHALAMAGVLANDFAALDDPDKERHLAASLKGN